MIAEVVVDVLAKQVNRSFDYSIPTHLENILKVGYRVKVLFGKRLVMGFVVLIKESTDFKKELKPIVDIVDVFPPLNEEFIELAKYIADNNFSYYASSLQTMIPTALKIKYQKIVKVINKDLISEESKKIIGNKKELIIDGKSPLELKYLFADVEKGYLGLDTKFKKTRNETLIDYVYVLDEEVSGLSKQGQAVLDYMLEINEAIQKNVLIEESGYSKAVIKTLIDKGVLGVYQKELLHSIDYNVVSKDKVSLTDLQQKAFSSVKLNEAKTYLLHGVTGSGKTEVYMAWIDEVLKLGKTAIMLVPEIALTPQITAIFKSRFGDDVEIMHSRLSTFERYSAWKKIINGDVSIVVGARSAIFAPLKNLGIIIIDEEHEKSYIQENNPKYDAKEIANLRSIKHKCPLILGSATPNVCDYYKALNGEYELITMPNRVNNKPLPECVIADMAKELKQGNKSVFSKSLKEELIKCYHNKEQSILFLNRRGYSSFVMCRYCGEVIKCPHCDVSLTYHNYNNTLKCHHCGYEQMNVLSCPNCGSDKIRYVGSGTQKVIEEISNLLPEAKVLRVDLDTTKKKEDYEIAFNKFKNHEADILVGTQMIAKGLDFSDVTLVGVVNADLALHYPSYDATMTAYNLIEQVSGRAGRKDKNGKVIIQTYQPNHFVIESAKRHDYNDFFNKEIKLRKMSLMPPFSNVIEIMVVSGDANMAHTEAKNMLYAISKVSKDSVILGPAQALPFKLADKFRFTIQVKVLEEAVLEEIKKIYPMYQNNKDVDIIISRM